MGIQQEIEKQKEIMKKKELDEKNKKMKQIKINKVSQVNFKSLIDNTSTTTKITRNVEKDREKALKLIKKYILFRGNYILKLRKYFNDWRKIVKNLQLQEFAKVIQEFTRGNLQIKSIYRANKNWKRLSSKIFYKKRIKILKRCPRYHIKKKRLYQLIKITKLHSIYSRRRFIHFLILVWHIYAQNIQRKLSNITLFDSHSIYGSRYDASWHGKRMATIENGIHNIFRVGYNMRNTIGDNSNICTQNEIPKR